MKNEKKNPFLCNVGLFSLSYFMHRVAQEKDFRNHTSPEVIKCYDVLRAEWAKNEKLLTHKKINESDTEKLLVDTVVKTLGYSYLTKSALASGEKSRRKKYPDYALFYDTNVVNQALDSEDEFKFSKALGVIEGKKFGLTLNDIDEEDEDDRLPAVQLIDYLQKTDLDWGYLTNGKQWQVYCRRGQYNVSKYFEVELTDLLSHPRPTHEFAVFMYLFGVDALLRDKSGKTRLDRLAEISKKYAQDVGIPFFEGCEHALRRAFEFYQNELKATKNQAESKRCHQAALILLFRLIAIRYLEDRGVLPVLDGKYRHLSLDRLRIEVEKTLRTGGKYQTSKFDFWNKIRILFKDVNSGAFGIYVGHHGFESNLFDIDFDAFFRDHPIPDSVLAEIVDAICRGKGKAASQIDFYDLGVEKIGDVYNQLLALRIVEDEKSRWNLTYSESIKKDLGSYFTHPSLTGLLSESVQKYLTENYPETSDWLKLRICDNSCGSGHFLRQMIEDISYALYISKANSSRQEVDKVQDQNSFRRMLAQHCIFGIDKDVNAVWLTKLSLWLHTAEKGKPFVFLDHHIIQGDSILSTVEIPQMTEAESTDVSKVISALAKQHSEDKAGVISSMNVWLKLKTLTKRYTKLQNPQLSFFETAKDIKETYFSYAQAFPEVFLNASDTQRGFNIIVGNPPWDTVKPKIADFFKMETGADKAPDRKVLDKWVESTRARKAKFDHYHANTVKYATAIKECGYALQAGEVYTYAYFTERSMQTLAVNGLLCYIVKLGLYGDEKVKKLRHYLFADNYMENMWIVKKNKTPTGKFFSQIDPNEKFLVFVNRKAGFKKPGVSLNYQIKGKEVRTFGEVNHEFLNWQKYEMPISLDQISKVTVYDSEELKTISDRLRKLPTIKSSGLDVSRELHITDDRKVFSKNETPIPVFSGSEIGHFKIGDAFQWCKEPKMLKEIETAGKVRLMVNNIVPNSRRKLRCTELPSGSLSDNSVLIIHGFKSDLDKNLVLAGLNSMLVDFYLRPALSNMNLNNFRLFELPVPFNIPTLAKQEVAIQVKSLSKAKKFSEELDAYKKIEGLLAACYGLADHEIRHYIEWFGPTKIVDDVVDYAKMYREEFGIQEYTAEPAKPQARKKTR